MYTYEKFNLRLFPLFLFIIGIALSLSKLYIQGSIFGSIGAVFLMSFKGFNIDAEKKQIRKYDRFLWFYLGKWQAFPTPLYVTVVRIKLGVSRNNPLPIAIPGQSKSSRSYKMNLVIDDKTRFIPLTYGNRKAMLEESLKIARLLNIKCLDHTGTDKQWLI